MRKSWLALVFAPAIALAMQGALYALVRTSCNSPDSDEGLAPVPQRFFGTVATAVAALAALVILAMWFATWVLSPCNPF